MRHRLAFALRRWATLLDDRATLDIPGGSDVHFDVRPGLMVVTITKPGLDTLNYYPQGHEPETHTARKLSDPPGSLGYTDAEWQQHQDNAEGPR